MMDPEMMKIAMETMSKMTPQQMAAMQQQMANIPQSVLQEQMRTVQNLTPEQRRMAAQQAKNFDPSYLASQTTQFAASTSQGVISEAEKLKREGNRLHGLGQYSSAIVQYDLASSMLQGNTSQEAKALVTACKLNMSSCYLNTGQHNRCMQHCSDVLRGDANNLKALFRRGQALLAQKSYKAAISDLHRAVALASSDEKSLIQASLDKARTAAAEQGITPEDQDTPAPSQMPTDIEEPSSPVYKDSKEGDVEDIDIRPQSSARSNNTTNPSISSDGTLPNQMATMEEMMKNPDTMRAMQSMMSSLKPEDLVAMQRQAGSLGSGLHSQQDQMMAMMQNPETMGMMQNIMAKMRPEDITVLQKQAAGLQGGFGSQGEQMQAMMNDPETLKAMQGMMKNIDSSDLAAMYKQAGMNITEEQAEQVAGTMKNMSPEQMAKLIAAATYLQRSMAILTKYRAIIISLVILLIGILWKLFSRR